MDAGADGLNASLRAIVATLRTLGYVNGARLSPDCDAAIVAMSRGDGMPVTVELPLAVAQLPPDIRQTAVAAAWFAAHDRAGPIRPPHGPP